MGYGCDIKHNMKIETNALFYDSIMPIGTILNFDVSTRTFRHGDYFINTPFFLYHFDSFKIIEHPMEFLADQRDGFVRNEKSWYEHNLLSI